MPRNITDISEVEAYRLIQQLCGLLPLYKSYDCPNTLMVQAMAALARGEVKPALALLCRYAYLVYYAGTMTFKNSRIPTMTVKQVWTKKVNRHDKYKVVIVAALPDGEEIKIEV